MAIWREKQPTEERLEEDSQNLVRSARPPVGRNLETHDFPPLPQIPTTEEVTEELQQVTRLYTSCDDPIESAARKQRVLVSDAQGLMEETAQGIIIAAHKAQAAQTQLQEEILAQAPIILLPAKPTNTIGSSTQQPTTGITGKKRGRPARTRDLRISPKTFTGASSHRRIMSSIHSSPGGAAGTPRGSKTSRDYLHRKFSVVHSGLKPENVLVPSMIGPSKVPRKSAVNGKPLNSSEEDCPSTSASNGLEVKQGGALAFDDGASRNDAMQDSFRRFNRHGDLGHIRRLRFWPLSSVSLTFLDQLWSSLSTTFSFTQT
ncbi:hypothetical protein Bca4012_031846 [Brassica carinata]|uniref:Uncharacterized protein n=1 Tax=Brassica carinata TaxID=52824 RepID=A0A8X7RF14_BRACI|nr:hypothetical protein Bca52824_046664 [Brassica carinata]